MPPSWTQAYRDSLAERFGTIAGGLRERLQAVTDGRVVPRVDDLPIGSARSVRATVLFFDIRGFSLRTGSPDPYA